MEGLPAFSIPMVLSFLNPRDFCRCSCIGKSWAACVHHKLVELKEDSARTRAQITDEERAKIDEELLKAVDNGDIAAATVRKEILSKGASVEAMEHEVSLRQSLTALMLAAKKDHLQVAGLLVTRGANVESRSDWGYTPLMWASRYGHMRTVKLLIAVGASIEAKDTSGNTALMWACMFPCFGSLRTVQLLIEKGANLDAKNDDIETAMYFATISNQIYIVAALISSGADTNAVSTLGTALDVAECEGYSEMSRILREAGSTRSRETLWDPSLW